MKDNIKKYLLSALFSLVVFGAIWWFLAVSSIIEGSHRRLFYSYYSVFRHPTLMGVLLGGFSFVVNGYFNKFKSKADVLIYPAVTVLANIAFTQISLAVFDYGKYEFYYDMEPWPYRLLFISWELIKVSAVLLTIERLFSSSKVFFIPAVSGFMFIFFAWVMMSFLGAIINRLPLVLDYWLYRFSWNFILYPVAGICLIYGIIGYFVIKKLKVLKNLPQGIIFVLTAYFTDYKIGYFGDLGTGIAALYVLLTLVSFVIAAFIDFIVKKAKAHK